MKTELQQLWLSSNQVAADLGITQNQFALLIERGELTEVRTGGRRRYYSGEVSDLKKRSRG